jgi:hypothetical protein
MNKIRALSAIVAAISVISACVQPARSAEPVRNCDCRAFGQFWRQGEQICLSGQIRVCGMSENVSSWIATGTSCPTATWMPNSDIANREGRGFDTRNKALQGRHYPARQS